MAVQVRNVLTVNACELRCVVSNARADVNCRVRAEGEVAKRGEVKGRWQSKSKRTKIQMGQRVKAICSQAIQWQACIPEIHGERREARDLLDERAYAAVVRVIKVERCDLRQHCRHVWIAHPLELECSEGRTARKNELPVPEKVARTKDLQGTIHDLSPALADELEDSNSRILWNIIKDQSSNIDGK